MAHITPIYLRGTIDLQLCGGAFPYPTAWAWPQLGDPDPAPLKMEKRMETTMINIGVI